MSGPENPPAFPSVCLSDPGHPASVPGRSLRDWFAGQAIQGFFAGEDAPLPTGTTIDEFRADVCANFYAWADAMLAARAHTTQEGASDGC